MHDTEQHEYYFLTPTCALILAALAASKAAGDALSMARRCLAHRAPVSLAPAGVIIKGLPSTWHCTMVSW